jgi:hypothetical protein
VDITLQIRTFNPQSPRGEDVWDEAITPSPEALDAALRRLNGDTTTTLVLERYADQNELDYQAFAGAIRSGRLEVLEGI